MHELPSSKLAYPLWLSLILAFTLTLHEAKAEVRLPKVFGDNMVLQQGMPLKVWGWAAPEEPVVVSLGEHTANTVADADGRWNVVLPEMTASKDAVKFDITGTNTIQLKNVLVGEVWLCSGQSNMEWSVSSSMNAKEEIAAADHPLIRHMKVARRPSPTPMDDVEGSWQVCSPASAGAFTACGYYMARRLQKELDVPVGLVNSSWGGTRVEPWTPPVGFKNVEALRETFQSVDGRTPGTDAYRQALTRHVEATKAWLGTAEESLAANTPAAPSPSFPPSLAPFKSHQDPTMLYNGMVHGLVGFPIRGAIWYQGESNHTEGMLYYEKKKALIGGWRDLWKQGDFPFYYVQIAPFQYGNENPEILAQFWEAQSKVEELTNTGMVVINDIATLNNIHPPNKQDVGKRLALLALKHDYGREDMVAHSPQVQSVDVVDGGLKLHFSRTGGSLKTRDGEAPSHFEVIGPGVMGYKAADAKIDGDSVILTSAEVPSPTAFRFAWHKLAEPNLTGATGLPVSAQRGGEEPDLLSMLSIKDHFQLVYDLDLSTLGSKIKYRVDNSASIEAFDRIGYLLELGGASGDQKVFVSMKAFTDDASKIGIPTAESNAVFQQNVESMTVFSTVSGISQGTDIATGNIEFWPHNYSTANAANVKGAAGNVYDFGDIRVEPKDGYGCMQIHNFAERQTIMAINHWRVGQNADLGIGNSTGQTRDWTFTGSAKNYASKRLRVYVKSD